jgi:hypothetical protein
MGSIIHVNKRPSTWPTIDEGYKLKQEFDNAEIIKIRYGSCDDDPDGCTDLEMYMRKSIYAKLISGEYTVSQSHISLRIVDKDNNVIPPVCPETIY